MNTRSSHRVTKIRSLRRIAGFTLIELMIAMILGLIVIAGVTSVFLAGQQSFRSNSALADVQDSARIAFELMARDIREAGLTGCNSVNGRVRNVLYDGPGNGGTAWWANWANAVHGYDASSSTADPALAGLTTGPQVAGTDSLELMSAAGPQATVALFNAPGSDSFTLAAATTALTNNDVAMVCSPSQSTILQIGYQPGSTAVTYAASAAAGNYSTELICDKNCMGSTPAPTTPLTFPPNSVISRLNAVDWYIGTNNENGTSLYRVNLVNGGTTTQTQEMVRNVTAMNITYLDPNLASPLGTAFQPADVISTNGGWADVTAIRVQLTMASTFRRAATGAVPAPLTRKYAFTTNLRNRAN